MDGNVFITHSKIVDCHAIKGFNAFGFLAGEGVEWGIRCHSVKLPSTNDVKSFSIIPAGGNIGDDGNISTRHVTSRRLSEY